MPIAALPKDTVRTLGSTQVLTDSASVVKELVDNALDARASSILVEISANALDILQVKDNGYGIAPIDRVLVCKRYCTSKIESFDDIASIGGDSLGFRGEALASAAEMSGSFIVTTKIEGEATATSLSIGRQGQIVSEERASHPVGTTVRVVDYLKNLPVRRQTAVKSSSKALSSITKTLQAYALARPAVRFSLKVLKAKNEKGNWTYAPKAGASVLDAATKLLGKKVAEQCHWKVWTSSGSNDPNASQTSNDSNETFTIECLLGSPGCDASSIAKASQFLSIDSRPVSCARGTFKQIISLYKSYLRKACDSDNGEKVVDPFLCMNIVCPSKSYDANIEPAKDDVLFSDTSTLLETVEAFFRSIYGELPPASKAAPSSKVLTQRPQGFDALLARKSEPATTSSPRVATPSPIHQSNGIGQGDRLPAVSPESSIEIARGISPSLSTRPTRSNPGRSSTGTLESATLETHDSSIPTKAWKSNMYADDDDDDTGLFLAQDHSSERPESPDPDEEASLRDIRVSNPWSLAKLNAVVRPQQRQQTLQQQLLTASRGNEDVEGASAEFPATIVRDLRPPFQDLPTPQQTQRDSSSTSSSPERFPYPLSARGSRSGEHALAAHRATNGERYGNGNGALDTWIQKSMDGYTTAPSSAPAAAAEDLIIDPVTGNTRHRDFVSARLLPTGTPLSEIPSAPTRPRRQSPKKPAGGGINKPFTSPLTDDRVRFEAGQQRKSQSPTKARGSSTQSTLTSQGHFQHSSSPSTSSSPERPVHPDLALTLDYENRKALAAQHHKANLLQQKRQQLELDNSFPELHHPSNSPHQNRYNKAIAALHEDDDPSPQTSPSPRQPSAFEAGDPRQYWLRVQEREKLLETTSPTRRPSTAKRRKMAMLPLETTKEEWSVCDLVLPVISMDLTALMEGVKEMGKGDEYVRSGMMSEGLTSMAKIEEIRAWEEQIRLLVERNYRLDDSPAEAPQLRIEIWPAMQKHWSAVSTENGRVEI